MLIKKFSELDSKILNKIIDKHYNYFCQILTLFWKRLELILAYILFLLKKAKGSYFIN